MSDSFDPYYHWLGIPPHEQPPDHYRLLGIARFESNPAVIQSAADELMARLRSYQTGPRGSYTQRLLNEVAGAKIRLLNPVTKQQYDAAISDTIILSSSVIPADFLPPEIPDHEIASELASAERNWNGLQALAAGPSPGVASSDRFKRKSNSAMVSSIVAGGLIIVLLAAVWYLYGEKTGADQTAIGNIQPVVSTADSTQTIDPNLVQQNPDGSLDFDPSTVQLVGEVQRETRDGTEVITNWATANEAATWRFKVTRLPSQGVFQVTVRYRANEVAAKGQFAISFTSVGEPRKSGVAHAPIKVRDIRESDSTIEDQFYLAVPGSGDRILKANILGLSEREQAEFQLESITLTFPKR